MSANACILALCLDTSVFTSPLLRHYAICVNTRMNRWHGEIDYMTWSAIFTTINTYTLCRRYNSVPPPANRAHIRSEANRYYFDWRLPSGQPILQPLTRPIARSTAISWFLTPDFTLFMTDWRVGNSTNLVDTFSEVTIIIAECAKPSRMRDCTRRRQSCYAFGLYRIQCRRVVTFGSPCSFLVWAA